VSKIISFKTPIKVLVNTSTLVVGGGIQIGVSFFEFTKNYKGNDFEFYFIFSKPILDNLTENSVDDKFTFFVKISPARPFFGWTSRRKIREIEKSINPDIVYSLGFPSYINFNKLEVARYTNPWEIFPAKLAWSLLSANEKTVIWLKTKYRIYWAKNAAYFETQTLSAKLNIEKKFGILPDNVKIIPNSTNPIFVDRTNFSTDSKQPKYKGIFCLSAAYSHKNLGIIPDIAKRLLMIEKKISFKFILTLPSNSKVWKEIDRYSKKLDVSQYILNIGPLNLHDCFRQYETASLVFLPTVLEVFSATYLEAMAMHKPIVTSDLEFAHEICGNSAYYFDPKCPNSAAKSIRTVLNDQDVSDKLIKSGIQQLKKFPTSKQKHLSVLKWLKEIHNNNNKVVVY